jgi:hypothetical protein
MVWKLYLLHFVRINIIYRYLIMLTFIISDNHCYSIQPKLTSVFDRNSVKGVTLLGHLPSFGVILTYK